jgi:hypothetical protein
MEYLEGNLSFKMPFQRSEDSSNLLSGYTDSILWKSNTKKTTALSTEEAEYYSASTVAAKVLYLRYLLQELGFAQQKPAPMYEDNSVCIEWGNNVIGRLERPKHIEHFEQEVIQKGAMRLVEVPRGLVLKRRRVTKVIKLSHVCPSEGCVTDLGCQGPSWISSLI